MATIHDVAAYITRHFDGPISTMKLQKLCYYAQGWTRAITGESLFDENFEAWARGPVSRELYREHRGAYSVSSWDLGDAGNLDEVQVAVVSAMLANYGALSGQQLSELTHRPRTPWSVTRQALGLRPHEASNAVITKEAIGSEFESVFRSKRE